MHPLLYFVLTYSISFCVSGTTKARFIKFSKDKKVFLLSRGKEDGIKENQHATFHNHEKKILRAEVLKLSPSRSIWQIYILYDEKLLKKDYAIEVRPASSIELI